MLKKSTKSRLFTLRLTASEHEALELVRERTGRSISEQIREQLNLLVFANPAQQENIK